MMTTNEKPKYFSVTPADVRYDDRLQLGARFLYGEISVLSNQKGYCWAGDSYFSKLYNVDKRTIQRWLMALEECGYITRTVKYKDGSKEIEKRFIRLREDLMPDNYPEKSKKMVKNEITHRHECRGGTDMNVVENNTSINNKNIRAFSTLESEKNSSQEATQGYSDEGSTDKQEDTTESTLDANFEKLWKLYPKKIGKKPALAAYKRVMTRKKNPATNKQIQDGIVAYKRIIANSGTDRQFIKNGSTFFNQESWNDYLEVVKEERDEQEARKPKFDPKKTAIEMYLGYSSIDRVIEQIHAEGIPIKPEDAKRYIAEYEEGEKRA